MTFHSACAASARADAERPWLQPPISRSMTRPTRAGMVKRCLDELGVDLKRFTPAAGPETDQRSQEPSCARPRTTPDRRLILRADGRRTPTGSTSARCTARTRSTSTTCCPARQRARAVPEVRERYKTPSATCSSTSTRTPTRPSTAGSSCWRGRHRDDPDQGHRNLAVVGTTTVPGRGSPDHDGRRLREADRRCVTGRPRPVELRQRGPEVGRVSSIFRSPNRADGIRSSPAGAGRSSARLSTHTLPATGPDSRHSFT